MLKHIPKPFANADISHSIEIAFKDKNRDPRKKQDVRITIKLVISRFARLQLNKQINRPYNNDS
jgi:intein-encoded DNA endonuclease-like protein